MITINLLPDELRSSQRTSPRTLGVLFVASVVCFGAAGAAGFIWFNVLAEREARVQIAQDQLDGLTPRAHYADALGKEKSEFEKREKTINEIAVSRIVWTKKLDRLSEVVNRDVTTGRHRVWLESLDVNSGSDTTAGGVKLQGFAAGSDINGYTNFHEDLKTDPVFSEGFAYFTSPSGKQADREEEMEPPDKSQFSFEAKLPVQDKKKPVVRKPAPAVTK